jgi:CubicO group peptidase (beta-lactamase class C family)
VSADRVAHWQAVLDAYQATRRLPTLVGGVLERGELCWTGAAGADVDAQYRIGSITKTLTGVLVLQCRDEGLLDLDDPLGRFVPESAHGDARLRALLSHSAGLHSEPVGPWWERSAGVGFAELVARNADRGRVFPAGTTYHYSNVGFALLGEVVARVRGGPWYDVLRERVLEPLGMRRTTYLPEPPAARGLSVHHLRGTLTDEPATDTVAMAPAGQLWSTVADLATFLAFLGTGGGVLARDTLAEMATPVLGYYGLATMRMPYGAHGATLVGHLGSMPGFQGCAFTDPGSGAGVVALTNGTTGFTGVELAERLLGDRTPPPAEPWLPTRAVPAWAEELLGHWYWGNSAYELRWHNERLEFHDLARGALAEQFVLRTGPAGDHVVGHAGYHHGEVLHVHRRPDGTVGHLECATFVYTRTPYDPAAPIPGGHPTPR